MNISANAKKAELLFFPFHIKKKLLKQWWHRRGIHSQLSRESPLLPGMGLANPNHLQSLGSTVQYTWPTLLATVAGFSTGHVSQPGKLVFLDSSPLEQTTSLSGVGDVIKPRTTWILHSSPLGTRQWSLLAWRQEGKMGRTPTTFKVWVWDNS